MFIGSPIVASYTTVEGVTTTALTGETFLVGDFCLVGETFVL